MKSFLICGSVCLLALASCSPKTEEAPESEEKPSAESAYQNPPIGTLVSKDHQITIHSSPEGTVYSVKDPDGNRLATEITREQLQANFPDLNLSEIWAEASAATTRLREGASPVLAD